MKRHVAKFLPGDIVSGYIVEILAHDELIVSFQGDLIRVRNEAECEITHGQLVNLRVTGVNPLRFQALLARPAPVRRPFDRTI
jgi:hypothetical protein